MNKLFFMAFVRFGMNAYLSGNYDKAEGWFRRIEAQEPDNLSVLRNLGIVLRAKGDAEGAERYLLREEKLYGKSFLRHAGLADLAYEAGRRKEARQRYALALAEPEMGPEGSVSALRPLMEKRLAICGDEKAFARTRQSIELFKEAQALRAQGRGEDAIDRYLESAKLDETNWQALNNAGTIQLNVLGQPEKAAKLFEKALKISKSVQAARNLDFAVKSAAGGKSRSRDESA
ncbi:MAG: tetratricopeptide repeat protein [Spirochaetes bacterium]|nr:tetratricopeptide repeat protein [Spirochaetota bacterium]